MPRMHEYVVLIPHIVLGAALAVEVDTYRLNAKRQPVATLSLSEAKELLNIIHNRELPVAGNLLSRLCAGKSVELTAASPGDKLVFDKGRLGRLLANARLKGVAD